MRSPSRDPFVRAVLLLISMALSGCGDAGRLREVEAERDQARAELEKARAEASAERSFISETTQVLNEVQDAITKIRRDELKITRVTARLGTEGVVKENQKQEMLRDIEDIEKALKDNEAKLANIEQKYQAGSAVASQAAGLKRLVAQLKETLREQQRGAQEMKVVVDEFRAEIRKKEAQIRQKDDALVEKDGQIQTFQEEARAGYVLVGSTEKLKRAGIAESKREGFLGMRRRWQLGKDLDKSFFLRVDTETLRELPIPFPKKKVEILSPHASSSYSLEENGTDGTILRIKDPQGFWQFRFLVVLTKP